jgi:WD40 repeat protein
VVDRTVELWDVGTGEKTVLRGDRDSGPRSVAFNADGSLVAFGDDRGVFVFDAQGQSVATLHGPWSPQFAIVFFTGDDHSSVSAFVGPSIVTWSLASGERLRSVATDVRTIVALGIPRQERVASREGFGVSLLDLSSGRRVANLVPVPRGLVVVGASGGVQILGDTESAKRSLTCQLAGRVYPFEACEDRLWEEDLLVGQTAAHDAGPAVTAPRP